MLKFKLRSEFDKKVVHRLYSTDRFWSGVFQLEIKLTDIRIVLNCMKKSMKNYIDSAKFIFSRFFHVSDNRECHFASFLSPFSQKKSNHREFY